MTTTVTFKYDSEMSRAYWSYGDLYTFRARRVEPAKVKRNGWELVIKLTTETAGIKHTIGQPDVAAIRVDTLGDARLIAAQFLDMVPTQGAISQYSCQRLLDNAAGEVYGRQAAAVVAEYDRINAKS